MTFPEGINTSQNPAETGQYGAGFFFIAENGAAVYGNKSYLLFQTKDTMKIFKGNGGTLTELASFAAPAASPTNASNSESPTPTEPPQNSEPATLTFNYIIEYTPITGEIRLFRDSIFIGSYTDESPLKSGQSIILMAHFTKTSFDNIQVKAGTKTETKAYNTHVDHLGSSSLLTAGLTLDGQLSPKTGQIVQLLDQYPYGEKRIDEKTASASNSESGGGPDEPTTTITSTFSTKKTFTGKELDPETGLYYYGARYYDSRLGRFISQDPTAKYTSEIKLFLNPQFWNSYSYTTNNPIRYTDPDGKCPDACVLEVAAISFILNLGGALLLQLLPEPKAPTIHTTPAITETKPQVTDQNPPKPETPSIIIDPVPQTKSGPNITTVPSKTGEKGGNILYTPKSQEDQCFCSLMNKERVKNPSKTESPIWGGFENYKNGIKVNGEKGKKKEYYNWDNLHNEIEVYNGKGIHKGVIDPKTGKLDESKRKEGRNIKDKL